MRKKGLAKMLWILIEIILAVAFILIIMKIYSAVAEMGSADEESVASFRNLIVEVADSMDFIEGKVKQDKNFQSETFCSIMDVQEGVSIVAKPYQAKDVAKGTLCLTKVDSTKKFVECQTVNARINSQGIVYTGGDRLGKLGVTLTYAESSKSFNLNFLSNCN
jgi:hypothetical protein